MKLFFILILIILSITEIYSESILEKCFRNLHREPPPPESISRAAIITEWIDQKLDNFDKKNNATWKMRYLINLEHFKAQSPIFIYVGGEWSISPGYITGGHFFDMGKELNAAFYYTEHRYYGKSFPTKDFSIENLKFLSVKQSLADLAYFINTIKKEKNKKNSKVVLAGGSYSATMVAWFKKQYPDLVVGVWSSSAPILAKVNFEEYFEVTGRSIKTVGGQKCYDRIENGIHILENMIENKKISEIKSILKICDNFNETNYLDVGHLFIAISNEFADLVQSHTLGKIENACKNILDAEDDLSGLVDYFLRESNDTNKCSDFTYAASLKPLLRTELIENSYYRQWTYQTCTEFGWYSTSNSSEQPFGNKFPVFIYEKICEDVYGIKKGALYHNIEKTNEFWEGLQLNVENVYFTHGSLDPWKAAGIHINEDGEKNVIPLYSHCRDFSSISENDSKEMIASKLKLKKLVKKWLGKV